MPSDFQKFMKKNSNNFFEVEEWKREREKEREKEKAEKIGEIGEIRQIRKK